MTGTIINIQHYAVNDGPGIRTLVFMKGCPLRCEWCCNPESQSIVPQLRYISFRCRFCGECAVYCPTGSVTAGEDFVKRNFEDCNRCETKPCIEHCNHNALVISGEEITTEELFRIISLDTAFYRNSRGGVTFSGGEPMMQPDFLKEILIKCHDSGIHTAVETCGWADKKSFSEILNYTDLFLFDLKITDSEKHEQLTGKSNRRILENLDFLASSGAEIIIRFPVIPGITDHENNLQETASLMKKLKLEKLQIGPYHTLGVEKYSEHGMEYSLPELSLHEVSDIMKIRDYFISKDLYCEIS